MVVFSIPRSRARCTCLILVLFHLVQMETSCSLTSCNGKRFGCKVCYREFNSGQVLGGHVRGHHNVADHDRQFRVYDLRSCERSKGSCLIDEDDHNGLTTREEEDMACCLVMLSGAEEAVVRDEEIEISCGTSNVTEMINNQRRDTREAMASGGFECKGCKKVFTSHQALGGHRASHKKVKGCYATTEKHEKHLATEEEDSEVMMTKARVLLEKKKGKGLCTKATKHECTVCCRVFSSGQALGGHKRCHWLTGNTTERPSSADIQYINLSNPVFEFTDNFHLNLSTTPSWTNTDCHSNLATSSSTTMIDRKFDLDQHKDENLKNIDCVKKRRIFSENLEDGEGGEKGKKDKLKLIELTEDNDFNKEDQRLSWLQVGIGSFSQENGNSKS